jgi:hypothetical protein
MMCGRLRLDQGIDFEALIHNQSIKCISRISQNNHLRSFSYHIILSPRSASSDIGGMLWLVELGLLEKSVRSGTRYESQLKDKYT